MKSWIEYWNSETPIYVSARHKALHYRLIATGIRDLILDPGIDALDYGCGEALSADLVAARCRRLILADAAPNVRARLTTRFAGEPAIRVAAPEEIAALPAESLDLVIVHSVAQYVPKPDFAALVRQLAGTLRPGGRIVIGDILPPDLSAVTDARALLAFGWQGGFLLPALLGLVRTALSDYRTLRADLGLTHYTEAEMLAVIEATGLTARRLEKNLGHNQARMAFVGARL
ncbi:MAG: class I SAM-dependent methyltransferase [Hyphomicrobiales bacterium]|nr:class I SAM-dependent methyltransferase [Hyphomicrobiales bacterium]